METLTKAEYKIITDLVSEEKSRVHACINCHKEKEIPDFLYERLGAIVNLRNKLIKGF